MADEPLKLITAEPVGVDVMRQIEIARQAAERGEISSIAICWVDRDGISTSIYSEPPCWGVLVGCVSALLHKLHVAWI